MGMKKPRQHGRGTGENNMTIVLVMAQKAREG